VADSGDVYCPVVEMIWARNEGAHCVCVCDAAVGSDVWGRTSVNSTWAASRREPTRHHLSTTSHVPWRPQSSHFAYIHQPPQISQGYSMSSRIDQLYETQCCLARPRRWATIFDASTLCSSAVRN